MGLILLLIGIAIATNIYFQLTKKKREQSKDYSFRDGYKLTRTEFEDALQLMGRNLCSNEYCKREIVTLFIDVRRTLIADKCWKDSFAFSEAILQTCKKTTLDLLSFQDTIESPAKEKIDTATTRLIQERATVVVRPLTRESDRRFYNSGDAWKVRYQNLINSFDTDNVQQFYNDICQLATMSDKRVTTEREIYLLAHQFLVHKDKEYSLKFYMHYLHVKTLSDTFKHKKISKPNAKLLFRNTKEEQQFNQVCSKLLTSKNLNTALKQFDNLEISQRKKVRLDITAIREAAGKQAKVAGILSDILADEPESVTIPQQPLTEVTDNKEGLLQLFINKDYKLNKEEVDIFARSKGLFMNQLIQSINEEHFDELDDVLIEEEEEYYMLNETYYEQLRG
ncbi:hypothetical protein M2459_000843 [Parabacteroides sp. PF5-5]|uniref:tellurite resistance TerB C-terminal domain-containing protein n=1 Tax=unclassified Parabacteroides TaxID=2649774 RepID=UPI002475B587|nr:MULTISPECIES: tellurite resistance TerB C-terminal domain-containing protein [unclassified Parabacteroides]MDH6304131.1 hypothetical protein [Parabacteroides sp. PH5-39]MDH6315169.1 hypothetical protein [Parabacteroides sp. PF5-13]MDH6318814.1 hypothetical protein [Parabacteroides sp. PH5-13]MDH6322543.1 hypothetical protein [Parabacteroides sp. PH5-8]MDH6326305.1 hypothetical protein [Parabacteroides sp. PH5-41]